MAENKDIDEKLQAQEINLTPSNRFLKWLDNFWFYHKWKLIVITFFAIVIIVGVIQIVSKDETDVAVIIAVPDTVSKEEYQSIQTTLVSLMPSDSNGDGKKVVMISAYPIYSEDEMKIANESETDQEGRYVTVVDGHYNSSKFEEYTDYLKTGEVSILFVSEFLYSNLLQNDRVRPLSDVFGENIPANALPDGHGFRLGDLPIYEFSEGFSGLPEDTVVCFLRSYIWGASSDKQKYSFSENCFKSIIGFGN